MVSTKREEMREKHELTDRVGIQAKVPVIRDSARQPFMCVLGVWGVKNMYKCVSAVWRPERWAECLPQSLATLVFEKGASNLLIQPDWLTSSPQ